MQNLELYRNPKNFRGKSAIIVQLWWIVDALFFRTSPQFFYGWRRFLLRGFGAKIGKKVIIRPTARFTYPWKVSIGDFSWVGDEVVFYSLGKIQIGSNTVISQRTYLCTGYHDFKKKDFPIRQKPIKIGIGCWVATDVFVAPGISIEDGTVVGARSNVLKDLPGQKICYGSPAKVIKDRKFE